MKKYFIPTLIVTFFILSLILRVYGIENRDLTIDELGTSRHLPDLKFSELNNVIGSRAPLPFLLQWITFYITNSEYSEFWVRLPNAIVGAVTVAMFLFLTTTIAGTRAAIYSSILFCVSIFHITISQDARYYPLVILFSLLYYISFYFFVIQQKLNWIILFAISIIGLFLSHHATTLLVIPTFISSLIYLPSFYKKYGYIINNKKYYFILFTSMILIFMLLLYKFVPQINVFWERIMTVDKLPHFFDFTPRFFIEIMGQFYIAGTLHIYYQVLIFIFCILVINAYYVNKHLTFLLIISITAPFLLLRLAKPEHFWMINYFSFMHPALFIILLLNIELLQLKCKKITFYIYKTCIVILLISVFLLNVYGVYMHIRYPNSGIQEMTSHVNEWKKEGQVIRKLSPFWKERYQWYLDKYENDLYVSQIDDKKPYISNQWLLYFGRNRESRLSAQAFFSADISRFAFGKNVFLGIAPSASMIDFVNIDIHQHIVRLEPKTMISFDALIPENNLYQIIIEIFPQHHNDINHTNFNLYIGEDKFHDFDIINQTSIGLSASLKSGYQPIKLQNNTNKPIYLSKLRFIPLIDNKFVIISAWNFTSANGGMVEYLYVDQIYDKKVLRGFRGHPAPKLEYLIYAKEDTRVYLQLEARHEPPVQNEYHIFINSEEHPVDTLSYNKQNWSFQFKKSSIFELKQGINKIGIQFETLSIDDLLYQQSTWDGLISTSEARQMFGALNKLIVIPVTE